MKLKSTFLKALNRPIIAVGYSASWYLLKDIERTGYNIGENGWNYDAFVFNDIIIVTGCRTNSASKNFDIAITDKWNKAAETIFDDYSFKYTERQKEIETLRNNWLKELKTVYGGNKK